MRRLLINRKKDGGHKLHIISAGIALVWFLSINCAWAKDGGFATLGPTSEFANEEEEWDEINWNSELVKTLMRINHPAIPKFRLNPKTQKFEIKLVKGMDMSEWARNSSNLSDEQFLKQLVAWAIEIGEAVVLLHQAGFEHGDVGPQNVVIEEKTGQPILIDFDDYIAEDVYVIRGLISISLFSRIFPSDFLGDKGLATLGEALEGFEAINRRFGREILVLGIKRYSSVAEFVQNLKVYFNRKWPVSLQAEAGLQASL